MGHGVILVNLCPMSFNENHDGCFGQKLQKEPKSDQSSQSNQKWARNDMVRTNLVAKSLVAYNADCRLLYHNSFHFYNYVITYNKGLPLYTFTILELYS